MFLNLPNFRTRTLLTSVFSFAVFYFSLLPLDTSLAATAYFETNSNTINIGDTALITVRLDTENVQVNVVEGDLLVKNQQNTLLRELSVAGADLTFWSRKPSWSEQGGSVSFVGGVPGGFNKHDGLLFTVALKATKPGIVTFIPTFKVYANDGKATKIPVATKPLILTIENKTNPWSKDELRDIVATDNNAPELLTADIGQDVNLFNGKIFLAIHATDNGSDIAYFEIKEGSSDPIRTGTNYVLHDQSRSTPITVYAYDKSGNVRTLIIPAKTQKTNLLDFTLITLCLLLGLIAFYLFKRRTNKKI